MATALSCVVCKGSEGELIKPCECDRRNGHYHYHCLGQWIASTADKPCPLCRQQFRDPRIERVYREPSFGEFLSHLFTDENNSDVQTFLVILMATIGMFVATEVVPRLMVMLIAVGMATYLVQLVSERYSQFSQLRHGQLRLHHWAEPGYPNGVRVVDLTVSPKFIQRRFAEPLFAAN